MNKNQNPNNNTDTNYMTEFLKVAERLTPKFVDIRERKDFIQSYAEWAFVRADLRAEYSPVALVKVSINQKAIDFLRKMGRQVPEGGYDAKAKRVRNKVRHLDAVLSVSEEGDEFTLADVVANTLAEGGDICEVLCVNDQLKQALSVLTPNQRTIFVLVHGHGYKVAELARTFGVRREWASKQLSAARRILGVRKGSLK